MISVFVIDDHPIVAQGVALVLDGDPDLRFVGACEDLGSGVVAIVRLRPSVVLLDVRLPGTDVATAVRTLAHAVAETRIVLFTAYPEHADVRRARSAGAVATAAKDTPPPKLRELIRAVVRGELLGGDFESGVLTTRQHDVLCRVATGMTNVEIAEQLGLQPSTVKAYWQETMQRLGVRNRAEAIAAAYQRGLL
ncbi:LuxR C-terminal-related transcriptional regulator [Nocardia sp. NPDC127606]|uniref:response regulator transcription factor n=1 Tax=Nocardia sp. NPDC127606 TaxID=3345406 RepID=UPI003641D65A